MNVESAIRKVQRFSKYLWNRVMLTFGYGAKVASLPMKFSGRSGPVHSRPG